MFKQFLPVFLFAALFAAGGLLPAQETRLSGEEPFPSARGRPGAGDGAGGTRWYRSNPSGMALEPVPSALAALRNEYCLSIEEAPSSEIPALLAPYYDDSFRVELRLLYEKGKVFRRQWLFRDPEGLVRLAASGNGSLFGEGDSGENSKDDSEENAEKESRTGFIEIRGGDGSLEREFRFEDDLSEWEFRFFYKDNFLLRAETWFKKPPAAVSEESAGGTPEETRAEDADRKSEESSPEESRTEDIEEKITDDEKISEEKEIIDEEPVFVRVTTDHYRYSRFGSVRAIDRVLHEAAGVTLSRLAFPRIGSDIHPGEELMSQGNEYTSDFLMNIYRGEGATISYSVDSRGRILGEVWKDEDGVVLGEFQNTWSGDRLQSVLWKSEKEERLVEYEYDGDGNRIAERNYNQGVLERSVISNNGRETEEIYKDGKLILRVLWENGLKISEQRVFR